MSKIVKCVISFVLLGLWMAVIFIMSAENGQESTDTSNGVVYYIAKITVADFESLSTAEQQEIMYAMSGTIRTMGHFCEFAVLGALSLNALLTFRLKRWQMWGLAFVFSLLYAVSDEIHQYFVPDRVCDIMDVAVDSLGALTGIAVLGILVVIAAKLKVGKHKNDTQNNTVG